VPYFLKSSIEDHKNINTFSCLYAFTYRRF